MHLLQTTSATLDDIVEPRDLGQKPGDIVVLSFADSDLSGLAAAYAAEKHMLPSFRLVHLRDLRHPMSIDLWIDKVGRHAKIIVVRLLGGLDWWRYGVEALSTMAREQNLALAVLPGEDRDDKRLDEASTLPPNELAALLCYFREAGRCRRKSRKPSRAWAAICRALAPFLLIIFKQRLRRNSPSYRSYSIALRCSPRILRLSMRFTLPLPRAVWRRPHCSFQV
jgi:hypothetical protein